MLPKDKSGKTKKDVVANWIMALTPLEEPKKSVDYKKRIEDAGFPMDAFERLLQGKDLDVYTVGELLRLNNVFFGRLKKYMSDAELNLSQSFNGAYKP